MAGGVVGSAGGGVANAGQILAREPGTCEISPAKTVNKTSVGPSAPELPPKKPAERKSNISAARPDQPTADVSATKTAEAAAVKRCSNTSQQRINELATEFKDRLVAGDTRGALDVIHGQRLPEGDAHFARRFEAALKIAAREVGIEGDRALLFKLSAGERVLYEAYINNPGGMSLHEDRAFVAVDGAGTGESIFDAIYLDLARRNPDPADYETAVARMDSGYLSRYGARRGNPKSLEADLTDGWTSELGGDDKARFRAARAQSPAALQAFLVGEGKTLGTSVGPLLEALAWNVKRPEAFAAEYEYVADGVHSKDPGSSRGVQRLEKMIDGELSGVDAQRARALIDLSLGPQERAGRFLQLTLQGYASGDIGRDEALRSIRSLTVGPNAILGRGAAATFVDLKVAEDALKTARGKKATSDMSFTTALALAGSAQDGSGVVTDGILELEDAKNDELEAVISQLIFGGETDGGEAMAAEFQRRLLNGGIREFGGYLDHLTAEQRTELFRVVPDAEAKIKERFPPQFHERLLLVAQGRADAVDLLKWAAKGYVNQSEVISRVAELGYSDRADFAAIFNERFGAGSFDEAVEELDNDTARALKAELAVPSGASRKELGSMLTRMRAVVGTERSDEGWAGFSSWFSDQFGFSGPLVDDALREVVHVTKIAADYNDTHGELLPEHARAIINAQLRLQEALKTYSAEKKDLAQGTADIAITAVSLVTLGSSLSVAVIARAALVAGAVNTGVRGAVEGPGYSASDAAYDFFAGVAMEATGIAGGAVVMRGASRAWGGLRRLGRATIRMRSPAAQAVKGVEQSAAMTHGIPTAEYALSRVTQPLAAPSPEVVEAAIADAVARVPGLTAAQAREVIERAFKRGSAVVFGGSRMRGNFAAGSDLDIGFYLSPAQATRVLRQLREIHGIPLERTGIVPGNRTPTIPRMESPEEFFMRSGVRKPPDPRAGETFSPSGWLRYDVDGSIAQMASDGTLTVHAAGARAQGAQP